MVAGIPEQLHVSTVRGNVIDYCRGFRPTFLQALHAEWVALQEPLPVLPPPCIIATLSSGATVGVGLSLVLVTVAVVGEVGAVGVVAGGG